MCWYIYDENFLQKKLTDFSSIVVAWLGFKYASGNDAIYESTQNLHYVRKGVLL